MKLPIIMKNKKISPALAIALIILTITVAGYYVITEFNLSNRIKILDQESIKNNRKVSVQSGPALLPLSPTPASPDVSYDKATNVFSGIVLEPIDDSASTTEPGKRYRVMVTYINDIRKGKLAGPEVVVNEPDPSKRLGQGQGDIQYQFYTIYDQKHDWYTIFKSGYSIVD